MAKSVELLKQRELFFAAGLPGQAARALELLKGLDDLQAEPGTEPNSLRVSYNLLDYSLSGLEKALIKQGFSFDDEVLHQIDRMFVHYSEKMEYHNLNIHEHPVKSKSREREIFVNVYDNHLHGDHDDTPEDMRDYR